MQIVLQEILQDKIYLDSSNEVRLASERGDEAGGLGDVNPLEV